MTPVIDVLIVDDSRTARMALRHALESDGRVRVVGEAGDGARAEKLVRERGPALVTMDVHLGDDDGIEVASRIMATRATPILVVTGVDPHDPDLAFRAMEAGALDVCPKPPGPGSRAYEAARRRLLRLVTTLSQVPVVTRRSRLRKAARASAPPPAQVAPVAATGPFDLLVVGASTGGPPVLHTLLRDLPAPFPIPIAIVQHISEGFVDGLGAWLSQETGHDVRTCLGRERLGPGRVYLAGDGHHLRVLSRAEIGPQPGSPRSYQRPSVDELFESAAAQLGGRVIGLQLTGMGRDGAAGLSKLAAAGAATIAQHAGSCVVDSMPESARAMGAVRWTVVPSQMGGLIQALVARSRAH